MAFSNPDIGNWGYGLCHKGFFLCHRDLLTPLAALKNWTSGVLGSKVLVSRRMKIVPEEQAAQFRGHQQGQKGKGGSSTGFHIGELKKYIII